MNKIYTRSRTLAPDPARQLDVLWQNRDAACVNRTKIGVLKETHEVVFGGGLDCLHGRRLEAQIRLEVLGHLAQQALERQLAQQELRRLLKVTNFAQGDGARAIAVWLFRNHGSGLDRSLLRQDKGHRGAGDVLARHLLRASHVVRGACGELKRCF